MIGLWSDLQKLTKKQFEAEVAKLTAAATDLLNQNEAASNQKEGGSAPTIRGDRPADRVARILTSKTKMPEREAASRLKDALQTLGIDPESLPPLQHKPLSAWLEELMKEIPAALVMNAAQQVVEAQPQN